MWLNQAFSLPLIGVRFQRGFAIGGRLQALPWEISDELSRRDAELEVTVSNDTIQTSHGTSIRLTPRDLQVSFKYFIPPREPGKPLFTEGSVTKPYTELLSHMAADTELAMSIVGRQASVLIERIGIVAASHFAEASIAPSVSRFIADACSRWEHFDPVDFEMRVSQLVAENNDYINRCFYSVSAPEPEKQKKRETVLTLDWQRHFRAGRHVDSIQLQPVIDDALAHFEECGTSVPPLLGDA